MICDLCPRMCHSERSERAGAGRCGMGTLPVIARAAAHFGEEPCLSGVRGSGAVFFCGCPLHCVFCQNDEISRAGARGKTVTPEELADIFKALCAEGVHNLNLVTAVHFAPAVAEALRIAKPSVPVIWNSGGYERVETLRMLEGLVDIYLPDYKYADAALAKLCSDAPDYPQVALKAIAEMYRQTGDAEFDGDGMMVRGTMVRHLILPGCAGASMGALSALVDAGLENVPVSLMAQYTPYGRAKEIPGLDRPVSAAAYRRVREHMDWLGLDGYTQKMESSGTFAIPDWNLLEGGETQ